MRIFIIQRVGCRKSLVAWLLPNEFKCSYVESVRAVMSRLNRTVCCKNGRKRPYKEPLAWRAPQLQRGVSRELRRLDHAHQAGEFG
jgi:hypothetical protein